MKPPPQSAPPSGLGPPSSYGSAAGNLGAAQNYVPQGYGLPPPRPPLFHTMSLGLLVSLPSLMFLLNSSVIVFLFHTGTTSIRTATSVCVSIALTFIVAGARQTKDGPKYWLNLGVLCLLATMFATTSSYYNWHRNLAQYWAYEGQRTYTNVLPSEPALSHLDAGKITFSSDAHLDTANSAGFKDGKDGKMYCVAPIVGSTPLSKVQYWAAGVDCCTYSGSFTCDEHGNRRARGGLVHLPPVHGGALGNFSPNHLEQFNRAAADASTLHGLSSSQDALFVKWVEDPYQDSLASRHDGIRFLVTSNLLYFGISCFAGVMLHFSRRKPIPNKWDSRRY